MTKYEFSIIITTAAVSAIVQAFAGSAGLAYPNGWANTYGKGYLWAKRLSFQAAAGNTGHIYIGNASVTNSGGNSDYQLDPNSTSTNAGTPLLVESFTDSNIIDLGQFFVHGSHATDSVTVSYFQE